MSTDPWAIAVLSGPCSYCGGYHVGLCPRVEAVEYYPNGTVKRVVLRDAALASVAAPEHEAGT